MWRINHIGNNRGEMMTKNAEKPDTLTAGLYVLGYIISGYLVIKATLAL
jgi:hypothetical protein